ncbi:DUF2971 domain-containing protein [Photobacterium halotolerans]|uniref:DUF2971 domain-containing protein n=1 Tax=Photobacterium halotolerans TaxID=265726 RepID=UPI00138AB454|nr:DUF2971 domain-containing protein [Photobacterium halotolerans]
MFSDPLLRLTPPSELNDPFDAKPTKSGVEKKVDFFFQDSIDSDNELSTDTVEYYKNELESKLNGYGVISLTENPYSLLMWSHYASEHKGVVIGIASDENTFDYHDGFTMTCGISKIKPARVSYSSRRPGFEMPDDCIYEYFENNFFSHFALTKGDDWLYEKEHRYLLSLNEADVIIADLSSLEVAKSISDYGVLFENISGNSYKIEAKSVDVRSSLKWWLCLAYNRRIISNVKFFKRIVPNAIRSVYFGCKVDNADINRTIESVRESPRFSSNVNFYRSTQSVERFEIDFELLDENYAFRK